jgi:hypothetical protein
VADDFDAGADDEGGDETGAAAELGEEGAALSVFEEVAEVLPYQSFTPLWPRHAPFFVAPV